MLALLRDVLMIERRLSTHNSHIIWIVQEGTKLLISQISLVATWSSAGDRGSKVVIIEYGIICADQKWPSLRLVLKTDLNW